MNALIDDRDTRAPGTAPRQQRAPLAAPGAQRAPLAAPGAQRAPLAEPATPCAVEVAALPAAAAPSAPAASAAAVRRGKVQLYYETLDRATYWRHYLRSDKQAFLRAVQADMGFDDVHLLSSGRAGIALSLAAAGLSRYDEVLVPPFMSACVLDTLNRGGFPCLQLTDKTKAVLLYHHWGYPQDFAAVRRALAGRELMVIEDCAHGFWARSNGVRIGEFGDTAIFSLSKVFEVTYSGLLRVNSTRYSEPIRQRLSRPVSLRQRWETWVGEQVYLDFYGAALAERGAPQRQVRLEKWYAALQSYPRCASIRGRLPTDPAQLRRVFRRQNDNFLHLASRARNRAMLLPGDELAEMAPLCFPFMHDDEAVLAEMVAWLAARQVFVGIYRFDINRNMFKPNYVRCVPIPLYASLDISLFDELARRFKGVL